MGSDDGVQQQQLQQEPELGYEEPEYKELEEGQYYEYEAAQLQLTEAEGGEQLLYQHQEGYQYQMQ